MVWTDFDSESHSAVWTTAVQLHTVFLSAQMRHVVDKVSIDVFVLF